MPTATENVVASTTEKRVIRAAHPALYVSKALHELHERYLQSLRRLHEEHGVPCRYGWWNIPIPLRVVFFIIMAVAAGVVAPYLGSHALRHSHATRQIDLGAPAKVVGDILGHVRPESTSVYVRVALQRLRPLALPVPL